MPNFLIIGAAKSGTTSLADYLGQHPDVFIPPTNKEPSYFALQDGSLPLAGPAAPKVIHELWYSHCITEHDRYANLFADAGDRSAVGEASVRYLYYAQAAERICAAMPNAKLVAVLREPVSRLYSHYCMNVQYQLEPLSLADAIEAEPERIRAGWGWDWHYTRVGNYGEQLQRYFRLFDREQIQVLLYDELVKDQVGVFQRICRHIGVEDSFKPDMTYRGKSAYRPWNLWLDRWLHWPRSIRPGWESWIPNRIPEFIKKRLEDWNSVPVPKIDRAVAKDLQRVFRDDVQQLEDLIGRKTNWYV